MGDHHHHHHHAPTGDADRRWIAVALAATAGIAVAEVVGGLLADSAVLLTDAAHNVTDAAAIALALVAARLALRPASGRFTFGWGRSEILSAQLNGAALIALGAVLGYDSVRRLADPPDVDAATVIALGVIGGAVNVFAAWALSRAERRSLNLEGARAHVLADLFGSFAAVVAGVVVLAIDAPRADPIAALVVVAVMLRSGFGLLRDTSRVLLEGVPGDLDADAIGRRMVAHPAVCEVHDLHVWEVTSGFPSLAAHVLVGRDDDCHDARRELERVLHDEFGIGHVTLQVDHAPTELLQIERVDSPPR